MKEVIAMKKFFALLAVVSLSLNVQTRDQVKIVGSSAVYPFASFVAEEFGSVSRYPTPVVESTRIGISLKLRIPSRVIWPGFLRFFAKTAQHYR